MLAGLACMLLGVLSTCQDATKPRPAIRNNPYFGTTEWKVWRDDPTPVAAVTSMRRVGKAKKAVTIELVPPPANQRIYPVTPSPGGPLVRYSASTKPSQRFAGIWDDVYSSWSGLHGYVRSRWRAPDGSNVAIRDQILHFVDVRKQEMLRCGVNFIHQSTTGMAHTITNGYRLRITRAYERHYFADLLVCSPAHASFTDQRPEQSSDLYVCHSPTLFNSLGSSNSETMAITKMILAGGYLPPATKLRLKRNGLYPAAMLYLWKAALPYDVPYDHELRHRVCYKAVGNRNSYPEKYSAAGIDKGDLCLPFHQYDDLEHMRRMVTIASGMQHAPPEACFDVLAVSGGRKRYGLHKAALVIQKKGETVHVRLSTSRSYDIESLPFTLRWKLLYGNKAATLESGKKNGEVDITVPWDDALPEGRTVFALIANNGYCDGNPALLTVYRQKGAIPPNGGGYKDYHFDLTLGNRRPVLLDLQDAYVRPGATLRFPLRAVDPEGFSVAFYKRAGEVGEIRGQTFHWKCPRKEARGTQVVTFIASDGTSGNSYAGKQVRIHVGKPKLLAHITADHWIGKAPLAVRFSATNSIASQRAVFAWEAYTPALRRKATPFAKAPKGKKWRHTFAKPGRYEVKLTVRHGKDSDSQTIQILVTRAAPRNRPADLSVEGNGVRITNGDETPSAFDSTDFRHATAGHPVVRQFVIVNRGDRPLHLASKQRVRIEGPGARSFVVVKRPERRVGARGRVPFTVRFRPHAKAAPVQRAFVVVASIAEQFRFAIRGSR